MPAISEHEYKSFQVAYDFFNAHLFQGTLPDVLITLQRHAHSRGYFLADAFNNRGNTLADFFAGNKAHELALNPDTFADSSDRDILSTLAHEMCHVWQQAHGKPPRRCYHDKEWGSKMKAIGLHPSESGQPGGKETGARIMHYITQGGLFEQTYDMLAAEGFRLNWQSAPKGAEKKKKKASKTKYTCPECDQNAWAKPDAVLHCGACAELLSRRDQYPLMIAEEEEPED